jgi:hypothetical protein
MQAATLTKQAVNPCEVSHKPVKGPESVNGHEAGVEVQLEAEVVETLGRCRFARIAGGDQAFAHRGAHDRADVVGV